MAIQNFVPHVFSAAVLRDFEKTSVFASVISRDYSGEISAVGDRVRVPKIAAVEIRQYQKGSAINYDGIDGTFIDIVVDQADYWALKCEDIDQLQAAPPLLSAATKNAAYALRDKIDAYSAGILTEAATKLFETTPYKPIEAGLPAGMANIGFVDLFSTLSMKFDELSVPRGSRWVVIPPFIVKGLADSVIAAGQPNERPLSEGFVSRICGLNVYVSNNLVTETNGDVWVLAGIKESATHIMQLTKTEALRDKDTFSDLIRGLAVYKTAALLPSGLIAAQVSRSGANFRP